MKIVRFRGVSYRLAASVRGERLLLSPELRSRIVAQWRDRLGRAPAGCWLRMFPGFDPQCPSDFGHGADLRAHLRSVEAERLGEFLLGQGDPVAALRAFRRAALAALDGAEYDHGRYSLPARFLRIRFLTLLDRIRVCEEASPRLRGRGVDDRLRRLARRFGSGAL